ncbi:hypothetical protein ACHAXR_012516, partial [Thalassiosira sp. AJA248-18]
MPKRKKRRRGILPSLLFLSAAPAQGRPSSYGVTVQRQHIARTYDPSNPSATCHATLHESDENGDGILQNYEYINFIADLSEGDFDVRNYIDLPFSLKINFNYLSCLCRYHRIRENGGDNCCKGPEAGIIISGTKPDEEPTGGQEAFLQIVCRDTQESIEFERAMAVSTSGPPTPAAAVNFPSMSPNLAPATNAPNLPDTTTAPTFPDPITIPTNPQATGSPTPAADVDFLFLSPNLAPATIAPTSPFQPETISPSSATTPIATSKPTTVQTAGMPIPAQAPTAIPTLAQTQFTTLPSFLESDGGKASTPSPYADIPVGSAENPDVDRGPGGDTRNPQSQSISQGAVAAIVLAAMFAICVSLYCLISNRKRDKDDLSSVSYVDLEAHWYEEKTEFQDENALQSIYAPMNSVAPEVESMNEHKGQNSSSSSLTSSNGGDNIAIIHSPPTVHSSHSDTQRGARLVTREDLNAAIEAGDYAAVGALAAQLADSPQSQADSSLSELDIQLTARLLTDSTESFDSSGISTDNSTSALYKMAEKGNWEGVVLAAAQLEGGLEDSTGRASLSSESQGHRQIDETKAEVEALIRRIVPEEI